MIKSHTFRMLSKVQKISTLHELTEACTRLVCSEILPAIPNGLCAAIYTQLSDVEDEQNGILTYDRKVVKINENALRTVNAKLKYVK